MGVFSAMSLVVVDSLDSRPRVRCGCRHHWCNLLCPRVVWLVVVQIILCSCRGHGGVSWQVPLLVVIVWFVVS